MRVICNETKCTGCLACVVTCLDRRYPMGEADALSPRLHIPAVRPSGQEQFRTESCHHCAAAPCMAACPVGALSRDENGFVVTDREKCVGCGACARACPYQIPRIDSGRKMVKCDGCEGDPACVAICPAGALRLGE